MLNICTNDLVNTTDTNVPVCGLSEGEFVLDLGLDGEDAVLIDTHYHWRSTT